MKSFTVLIALGNFNILYRQFKIFNESGLFPFLALIAGAYTACLPGYAAVADKCYLVPGLPQRYSWWSSQELCSVAFGNLFRVVSRLEWDLLNSFLLGLGKFIALCVSVACFSDILFLSSCNRLHGYLLDWYLCWRPSWSMGCSWQRQRTKFNSCWI